MKKSLSRENKLPEYVGTNNSLVNWLIGAASVGAVALVAPANASARSDPCSRDLSGIVFASEESVNRLKRCYFANATKTAQNLSPLIQAYSQAQRQAQQSGISGPSIYVTCSKRGKFTVTYDSFSFDFDKPDRTTIENCFSSSERTSYRLIAGLQRQVGVTTTEFQNYKSKTDATLQEKEVKLTTLLGQATTLQQTIAQLQTTNTNNQKENAQLRAELEIQRKAAEENLKKINQELNKIRRDITASRGREISLAGYNPWSVSLSVDPALIGVHFGSDDPVANISSSLRLGVGFGYHQRNSSWAFTMGTSVMYTGNVEGQYLQKPSNGSQVITPTSFGRTILEQGDVKTNYSSHILTAGAYLGGALRLRWFNVELRAGAEVTHALARGVSRTSTLTTQSPYRSSGWKTIDTSILKDQSTAPAETNVNGYFEARLGGYLHERVRLDIATKCSFFGPRPYCQIGAGITIPIYLHGEQDSSTGGSQ